MSTAFLAIEFNPMAFDPSTFVLTNLTFLVLLVLLTKFVWKPTLAAIATREDRIEASIKQAEDARKHADELLASYEARVADAENEVAAIREKGRTEAEALGAELKAQAEADARARIDRAAAEIELMRTQAVEDIRQEAVSLGMAVASTLVGRSLDGPDQQRLAAEVVSSLPSNGGGS